MKEKSGFHILKPSHFERDFVAKEIKYVAIIIVR